MSGYSEAQDCPKCKTKLSFEYSHDEEGESGECHECGYYYHKTMSRGRMSLEELNIARLETGKNSVKILKKWR